MINNQQKELDDQYQMLTALSVEALIDLLSQPDTMKKYDLDYSMVEQLIINKKKIVLSLPRPLREPYPGLLNDLDIQNDVGILEKEKSKMRGTLMYREDNNGTRDKERGRSNVPGLLTERLPQPAEPADRSRAGTCSTNILPLGVNKKASKQKKQGATPEVSPTVPNGKERDDGRRTRRPKPRIYNYVDKTTNYKRYRPFRIHLQTWDTDGNGIAKKKGKLTYYTYDYSKTVVDKLTGQTTYAKVKRDMYCDFVERRPFREVLGGWQTINKKSKWMDDPWWKELSKHLIWWNHNQVVDNSRPPIMVSFSQVRVWGKKGHPIGFNRDKHVALIMLRNPNDTINTIHMMNGPYRITFNNFKEQFNQTKGRADYIADWWK